MVVSKKRQQIDNTDDGVRRAGDNEKKIASFFVVVVGRGKFENLKMLTCK